VFDLALAVTVLDAGVSIVYAFDTSVFSRVPGLTARVPQDPKKAPPVEAP
jgi:hypothetical protein